MNYFRGILALALKTIGLESDSGRFLQLSNFQSCLSASDTEIWKWKLALLAVKKSSDSESPGSPGSPALRKSSRKSSRKSRNYFGSSSRSSN